MHRVGHRRLVDEDELDTLALGYGKGRNVLVPRDVIDRPDIAGHFAGEAQGMDAVGLAGGQWLLGSAGAVEIERGRRGRRFCRAGDSAARSAACDQDDSSLLTLALELGENWIGAGARRKLKANIEPLRDRGWKVSPADRRDREAVGGDEFGVNLAQPDGKR